jgi:diguanylate cyclase (GGDEF)-like protein
MMQWLQLNWQQLLIGFTCGVVLTALLAWVLFYLQQKKWQLNVADQLEDSIQQRTLELQITLTELADKNKQLEQQSTRDALTGVRNRAFFDQKLSAEIKRSRRERSTLGLLMIDIDHFKAINDNHGHLVGDLVIKEVANCLQQELKRSTDHLCRYGGEEFAIILPNTDNEGARVLAEQVRLCLANQRIQYEDLELSVTVSIGCYAAVAEINSNSADYIQAADTALYQAKHEGRNKVVCSALSHSVITEQETPDESV